MDTLELLRKAVRGGWKTSEFWLSLAAIAVAGGLPDKIVGNVGAKIAEHGTAGAIAAGAIAGAYSIGRSIVKASTAKGILQPVDPPAPPSP